MHATWAQVTLVLLPVIVGAAIGVVPTLFLERARVRAKLRTRWDADLRDVCAEFAATARRLLELAEEVEYSRAGTQRQTVADTMRSEHGRLQVLMAEVRLLAGVPVQLAARQLVRHAWALQEYVSTGADPRAADFDPVVPRERVLGALFDFYRATRRQLQVHEADGLAPVNPELMAGQAPERRPS